MSRTRRHTLARLSALRQSHRQGSLRDQRSDVPDTAERPRKCLAWWPVGFDHKVWTAKPLPNGADMTLVSPDGDMGFPGTLTAHVRYTPDGSALKIDYTATTDKPAVVNLTNYSYFNLAGQSLGTILDHWLKIDADRITPVDVGLIPTGKLEPVAGTPFDFRTPHRIGERIGTNDEQTETGGRLRSQLCLGWIRSARSGAVDRGSEWTQDDRRDNRIGPTVLFRKLS